MPSPSVLIDRVETKRFEKYRRFSIICSTILIILGILKMFVNSSGTGLRGTGYWLDLLLLFFVFPIISLFLFAKKNEKNRTGQFIEWWNDKLVYKSKESASTIEIIHDDITAISISLDNVEISTKHNGIHVVNLFDYTDYDMRLRIKSNFEKYKVTP